MSAPWGISQLVSTVAARALASPHVGDGARRLFAAIAEMATYTEARRLDVWESEVLALQRTAIGRATTMTHARSRARCSTWAE